MLGTLALLTWSTVEIYFEKHFSSTPGPEAVHVQSLTNEICHMTPSLEVGAIPTLTARSIPHGCFPPGGKCLFGAVIVEERKRGKDETDSCWHSGPAVPTYAQFLEISVKTRGLMTMTTF